MFESKRFQKKKKNRFSNGVSIAPELLVEQRRRRIDLVEREKETDASATLPGRTRLMIRIKLFFKRLWIKIQKL
jgi:hypothetical protein